MTELNEEETNCSCFMRLLVWLLVAQPPVTKFFSSQSFGLWKQTICWYSALLGSETIPLWPKETSSRLLWLPWATFPIPCLPKFKMGLSLKIPYLSLAAPHGTHLIPMISLRSTQLWRWTYIQCTDELYPGAHLFPLILLCSSLELAPFLQVPLCGKGRQFKPSVHWLMKHPLSPYDASMRVKNVQVFSPIAHLLSIRLSRSVAEPIEGEGTFPSL